MGKKNRPIRWDEYDQNSFKCAFEYLGPTGPDIWQYRILTELQPIWNRWLKLMERLRYRGGDESRKFERIVLRHSEPHRRYHTMQHVESCLKELDGVLSDWGAEAPIRPDEMELALWYHDLHYNPENGPGKNERISADYMLKAMKAHLEKGVLVRVERLILFTDHKRVSDSLDYAYIADIDLAILGTTKGRYDKYARQIRVEYALVPDIIYKPGRRKFLQGMLDREQLYRTDYFREKYEKTARENIERELKRLN
jgi:predicted metal-dependent HD superfamily phosphohydrolase